MSLPLYLTPEACLLPSGYQLTTSFTISSLLLLPTLDIIPEITLFTTTPRTSPFVHSTHIIYHTYFTQTNAGSPQCFDTGINP
jgi:hypothetical protein